MAGGVISLVGKKQQLIGKKSLIRRLLTLVEVQE